ncbi:hypothetical protein LA6_000648 [Marinibacterium anthonyi]|nr:hypothetical protein LA6_000648 [Marinibacterium anthonyi]
MLKPLLLSCALMAPLAALAQSSRHDHAAHMGGALMAMPMEPGNDAFGALAEIVAILRADPGTDWSRVDIPGLRAHLLDMEAVFDLEHVIQADTATGVALTIPTDQPGGDAAGRMVPAHGPVLAGETGWSSQVEVKDGVIEWVVEDARDGDQIRALGVFGLMAVGNHHPAHHLAIASGQGMSH